MFAEPGLLAALALIFLSGDREIDWLDLVLSELHLGATYDAIARRRLWRRVPIDVLVVPLAILAATYLLAINSQGVLITSIAMYAAVWHRGRQSLGIARFYQRLAGGSISPLHSWLFAGTIYLPMTAAIFLYGHLAPEIYEGEPYYALRTGADLSWGLGLIAAGLLLISSGHRGKLSGGPNQILGRGKKFKPCIRASVGSCSRTPLPLVAPTCSVLAMLRFFWSSPSITKCSTFISLTRWRGRQRVPANGKTLLKRMLIVRFDSPLPSCAGL